jgi:type IVB pilus formation R64 PilN family outer membrane protein
MQAKVDSNTQATLSRIEMEKAKIVPVNSPRKSSYVVRDSGAWLGAKSIELTPDTILPEAFNKTVTMVFPGRVNVGTVAERISMVTGVPVRVSPDVAIPQSALQSASASAKAGATGSGTPSTGTPPPLPSGGFGSASTTFSTSTLPNDMPINFTGKLSDFLDSVEARFGVSWEYRDGGVRLFRLVTKTFRIKAHIGSSQFDTQIGKAGGSSAGSSNSSGGSGGGGGSFTSTMAISTQSKFSVWDNLDKAVRMMLTSVGQMAISESTGTITVTDTREIVEKIGRYIDAENAILSKQIAIQVDIFSVTIDERDEFGINWEMVYSKLASLTPLWTLKSSALATLTSAEAGGLGLQIVAPTKDPTYGQVTGSQALFKALNAVSKAEVVTSAAVVTSNRQPVPVANTSQVTYLARTTPATTSTTSAGSGVPGLEPGQVTTGFLMNALPTLLDDENVMLQISIDTSTLERIGTISTGSGATQQTIQTPEVSGRQFMQRVSMRCGETLVLTGFERAGSNYDRRALDKNAAIIAGGSIKGGGKREIMVVLLTPMAMEGI